jgi:hypothetical protein
MGLIMSDDISSYEMEYEKSYDPVSRVLTARPITGHRHLPTLYLNVAPDEVGSVVAQHRTRTMDPAKPGITAYLFGVPGNMRIVHHDGEVLTVDSHGEALTHERQGEQDILRSAFDRQPASQPAPIAPETIQPAAIGPETIPPDVPA